MTANDKLLLGSSRSIGWHAPSQSWRVQCPAVFNEPVRYFSVPGDGSREAALLAAKAWRNQAFAKRGQDPAQRRNYTKRQKLNAEQLPITETVDQRNGRLLIIGYWMQGSGQERRQRKITRTVNELKPYSIARAEVEAAVRAGLVS